MAKKLKIDVSIDSRKALMELKVLKQAMSNFSDPNNLDKFSNLLDKLKSTKAVEIISNNQIKNIEKARSGLNKLTNIDDTIDKMRGIKLRFNKTTKSIINDSGKVKKATSSENMFGGLNDNTILKALKQFSVGMSETTKNTLKANKALEAQKKKIEENTKSLSIYQQAKRIFFKEESEIQARRYKEQLRAASKKGKPGLAGFGNLSMGTATGRLMSIGVGAAFGGSMVLGSALTHSTKSMLGFAASSSKALTTVGLLAGGIVGLTAAFLGIGSLLALNGMKMKENEMAFERYAASFHLNSRRILKDAEEISGHTIDRTSLSRVLGRSLLLGVDPTMTNDLMKAAVATAKLTGQTVEKAFEDINLAVGRRSRLILDNLGIIVLMSEAEENYAKALGKTVKELTAAQRHEAFGKEVLRKTREIVAIVDISTGRETQTIQRLSAAWGNFVRELSLFATGGMGQGVISIVDMLGKSLSFLTKNLEKAKRALGSGSEGYYKALDAEDKEAALKAEWDRQAVEIGKKDKIVRGLRNQLKNKHGVTDPYEMGFYKANFTMAGNLLTQLEKEEEAYWALEKQGQITLQAYNQFRAQADLGDRSRENQKKLQEQGFGDEEGVGTTSVVKDHTNEIQQIISDHYRTIRDSKLSHEIEMADINDNSLQTSLLNLKKSFISEQDQILLHISQLKYLEQISGVERSKEIQEINEVRLNNEKVYKLKETQIINNHNKEQFRLVKDHEKHLADLEMNSNIFRLESEGKIFEANLLKIEEGYQNEIEALKLKLEEIQKIEDDANRVRLERAIEEAIKRAGVDKGLKIEKEEDEEKKRNEMELGPWKTYMNEMAEGLKNFQHSVEEIAVYAVTDFGEGFGNAFMDFIEGTVRAEQAFKEFAASFLRQVARMIIQALILKAIQTAIGFYGGGSAPTVAATTSASSLGGSLGSLNITPNANGGIALGGWTPFASGGIVTRPTLGLVGEGKESEAILPLSKLDSMLKYAGGGDGGGVNMNMNIVVENKPGSSPEEAAEFGKNIGRAIDAEMMKILARESRAGGLLHGQYRRSI